MPFLAQCQHWLPAGLGMEPHPVCCRPPDPIFFPDCRSWADIGKHYLYSSEGKFSEQHFYLPSLQNRRRKQ